MKSPDLKEKNLAFPVSDSVRSYTAYLCKTWRGQADKCHMIMNLA